MRNLPSDVTKVLLQCLFPEASEIKLNVDRYGKFNRRSSIIIFPKVSHALYYADQDRSIKLDRNLLSIQSLVHSESSASSKKDQESVLASKERDREWSRDKDSRRDKDRGHEKDRSRDKDRTQDHTRDRPGKDNRDNSHPRTPYSHHASGHRSAVPRPHSKLGDEHESHPSIHRDAHARPHTSRHEDYLHRSSDSKNKLILVKNLPLSVNESAVFSIIPNAKDLIISIDQSRKNSAVCVVEFFTDKEAEVFLRKGRRIKLDQHVLTVEPYRIERTTGQELDLDLQTRGQSPTASRRHIRNSPSYRLPQHRSRSPLLQRRSPQLHSTERQRSPLFPSAAQSIHSSNVKNRPSLVRNDRYHFIANKSATKGQEEDEMVKGGGDRRFVSLTSRVNEQFNSKQWDRYFDNIQQPEHDKFSDKQSNTKVNDIFNQFKDQAKKFASENPDSARALNELLVALGHTNKTNLSPSFFNSLDDLQKAFNPEDKLHSGSWCQDDFDFRPADSHRSGAGRKVDPKLSSFLDIRKLSSVLEQVKDLSQNLGILSKLSKLAKHLKADNTDSNTIAMALSALENLVSKTIWSNSSHLQDDSRTNPCYNNQSQKYDTDQHFSPLPDNNYYNTAENVDLQNEQKYKAIDYHHQKPADKMETRDRSSRSPYRNESYHRSQYDDTHGFKNRHRQDNEATSQSGHRSGHNHEQYNQMSQPFEESFHDNNNWHQNSGVGNQMGPRDPKEFGLMDHDDRVRPGMSGPNKYSRDTDSRYNQMPDMNRDAGYYPDHGGNSYDEGQDNLSRIDDGQHYPQDQAPHAEADDMNSDAFDQDKPMGWRYYSMGLRTFRWT